MPFSSGRVLFRLYSIDKILQIFCFGRSGKKRLNEKRQKSRAGKFGAESSERKGNWPNMILCRKFGAKKLDMENSAPENWNAQLIYVKAIRIEK